MTRATLHEKMTKLHSQSGSGMQSGLLSYEVALKGKKEIAENTYAFKFEKPKGFRFTAGQHIRMTLINPPETDNEGDSRFWTLASSPLEKGLVIAMRMRNTAFKRVLARMSIGTKVRIQMREHTHDGTFILHEDTTKPAIFLVGGIGIVPAFSIIKDAIERKLPHRIVLFYSNRQPEDAPYLAELQELSSQHPSFTLIATMTETENLAKKWRGETGRIDHAMLKRYAADLQAPIYYIAGLPGMVNEMRTLLTSLGISEAAIRAEEFAGFTMSHDDKAIKHTHRSRAPFIVIALVVLAVIGTHGAAAFSVFNAGQGGGFLKNLVIYLIIGFTLGIAVLLKLRLLSGFRHGKNKSAGKDRMKELI